MSNPRKAYRTHKNYAAGRGIIWRFTYISWWKKWCKSGHWKERGRCRGQYQMARFGDKGAYSPDNVRICTIEENLREATHKFSKEARTKISVAMQGNKHRLGIKCSIETKRKMSVAHQGQKTSLGKKHSSKTRSKMSAARRKWWFEKKQREFTKRKLADLCLL